MWYEAKREFIEGAARVMWADAWAQWQESHCKLCGHEQDSHSRSDGPCEECAANVRALQQSNPNRGDMRGAWHHFKGASFSGQELTDIAPPTPQYALYEAAGLLARLEQVNSAPLATLLRLAGEADAIADGKAVTMDSRHEADAREFGSDIALQALGHGVSWFDDHAQFELTVPHIEFEYQEGEE
jgi:hypothetical protein